MKFIPKQVILSTYQTPALGEVLGIQNYMIWFLVSISSQLMAGETEKPARRTLWNQPYGAERNGMGLLATIKLENEGKI